MKIIIYENIPCPILETKDSDSFLILFKGEIKWIYKHSDGYGIIIKCNSINKNCECSTYIKEEYKYHREYGPAIEYSNGDKEWFVNDQLHRLDGPALEYYNGDKFWYQNGKLHRLDGPAVEYSNGSKQYWEYGIKK